MSTLAQALVTLLARLGVLRHAMRSRVLRRLLPGPQRVQAWNSLGATIAPGAKVSPGVNMRFPENVSIGAGSSLGARIWLDSWGPITIGANVQMNGDIALYSAEHVVDSPDLLGRTEFVEIGNYAWLANHIIVLPGVRVGRCAVIGTGSVVSRDVPDYAVAVGNPARVVKERARVDFHYRPNEL